MKLRNLPLVAFAAVTFGSTLSNAISFGTILRKGANIFRECDWDPSNPVEKAMMDYERVTTPVPAGATRSVKAFQESDFESKPWLREFEYVIVINNSNSVKQNETLPTSVPVELPSLATLGLVLPMDINSETAAVNFSNQYGQAAQEVRSFGSVLRDSKQKTIPSGVSGAQTIRIYQNGKLLRVTRVSTGRAEFELRGRNPVCKTRPPESYYSITEPGYFTFQEMIKSGYKSASYDDSSMPNAMFYIRNRGIALHEVSYDHLHPLLGRRASGGCTRLDPDTATNLFDSVVRTRGASIPVINVDGTPVLDANGRLTYKNEEIVKYYEGTSREYSNKRPTYSALLIIQPDTVVADPQADSAVSFKWSRERFNQMGPAPL